MPVMAKKRFGQHFLHDRHIIARIIAALDITDTSTVVEIGPGQGALTLPLLERLPQLHVIEIDRDLAALLRERIPDPERLVIHCEDALEFDLCERLGGPLDLIGNLPYNISTPLLFHLLAQLSCVRSMIFMLQKEVAERICAAPGNGEYGRLSVMVQAACEVEYLFTVGPGCFRPPPRVDSAVIRLTPAVNRTLRAQDPFLLSVLVRTAFSQRRKTLRNALKSMTDETTLLAAGIDPGARPETLSVDDYLRLANLLTGAATPAA